MLEGIILGFIQGLTEFIPVSSSGHLILIRDFLNLSDENGLAFDAILQLSTALAVLVYFVKDFKNLLLSAVKFVQGKEDGARERTLLKALLIGTIPAVIAGLLLESYMEGTFRNSNLVALTLIAGAALFAFAELYAKKNSELTVKKGLGIGLFQILALIPGMSRSGSTISGALFLGLTREEAARFSFLLAFPIIVGSGAKKLFDLLEADLLSSIGLPLAVGSVVAFLTGILAIHILLKFLKNHTLGIFIAYRVLLAAVILLVL